MDAIRPALDGRPCYLLNDDNARILLSDRSELLHRLPGLPVCRERIRRFIRSGPAIETIFVHEGVEVVAPGSVVLTRDGRPDRVEPPLRPVEPPLPASEVEQALAGSVARHTGGGRVAFALSGGLDSTTLVALAKVHGVCEPVCFAADTGRGLDRRFADLAARTLGVELHFVLVPTGRQASAMHRRQTRAAGGPVPLIGNSVGFAFVCRAAARAGFDTIVDGTGAEQVFAGNYHVHGTAWAADQLSRGRAERVEQYLSVCARQGIRLQDIRGAVQRQREAGTVFADFMWHDLTAGRLRIWENQHSATERAVGIRIAMPFVDREVARYIHNDPDVYFEAGFSKSALRRLLAQHVGDEIAWRVDNQGLRWPTGMLMARCRSEMRRCIRRSGVHRYLRLRSRAKLLARVDKGNFLRSYAVAVALETLRRR